MSVTSLLSFANFRSATIFYRTDLRQDGPPDIPLGVLAEIEVGKICGLGLRVRREITQAEIDRVAPFFRELARRPFHLLKNEFGIAVAPGLAGAFERMVVRNATSVLIQEGETARQPLPANLRHDADRATLRRWSEDMLRSHLASLYWPLMPTPDVPDEFIEMPIAA